MFGVKAKVQLGVTGSTLTFEAPQGRPSADGTVTVYDPRYEPDDATNNPITTGTASRKAVSTTLTGAAGPSQSDARNVPVAPPGALAVGDFVVLTNASGESERIEVMAKTASTVTAREPLLLTYASGALFESAVMTSPALDASWISDEENLIEDAYAVWTYTVSGSTYRTRTYWDLVREIVDWSVPSADLIDRYPDMARFTFGRDADLMRLQRAAIRDVDREMVNMGFDPDRLRGNQTMKQLVEIRWALLAAENGIKPNGRDAQAFRDERLEEWRGIFNRIANGTLKLPYDSNHDDVITPSERRASSRRLIR